MPMTRNTCKMRGGLRDTFHREPKAAGPGVQKSTPGLISGSENPACIGRRVDLDLEGHQLFIAERFANQPNA